MPTQPKIANENTNIAMKIIQSFFIGLRSLFRKRLKPIESLILTIRGSKVLIDADLAAIYGVETRALNQAVKRNSERFPKDFIFQLNAEEKLKVITNCDHLAHVHDLALHNRCKPISRNVPAGQNADHLFTLELIAQLNRGGE